MNSDDNKRLKRELQVQKAASRKIKYLAFKSQVNWMLAQIKFSYPWLDRLSYAINLIWIYWLYTHHSTGLVFYIAFILLTPTITFNKKAIAKEPGPAHGAPADNDEDLAGYMKRIHNQARKHD